MRHTVRGKSNVMTKRHKKIVILSGGKRHEEKGKRERERERERERD